MKTLPVARFLGINNRLPDTALRIATSQLNGQYLKSADNVEVDNAGKLRRRKATTKLVDLPGAHSLLMATETTGYLVVDSALYAVTLPAYTQTLVKILASNTAMSYTVVGPDTFFSNDTDSGRLVGSSVYPIGLPTPDTPAPSTVAGGLLAGWYQIGVSYVNETTGEEGGISPSCNHELVSTGGVRVTLPAATAGATHVDIYLSGANGGIPLHLERVAAGTATYDCVALATGHESNGRFEQPLPAGTLFASNGLLCSFKDKLVAVGLPFRPGYYLPAEGYIPFNDPVAIAVENQGGTYIATAAETFWVPGSLGEVQGQLSNPLPYGAVPGTAFAFTFSKTVGWFSTKGVVYGTPSGEVTAPMADNIDLVAPATGIAKVFSDDGHVRVMTCGWCVNLENSAATQYSDWDFTSLSGSYGTKSDGIYQTGTIGAVDASFNLGRINFGTEELKHLPAVYSGVSSATEMELTVGYVDERGNDQSYIYPTRGCGEALKIQRFDTGKGIRASWFELSISNTSGSYFSVSSLSFAPTAATRRI